MIYRIFFLSIFFCILVVKICSSQEYHVSGKVVNQVTKEAISNASVRIGKKGTLSDENGNFYFKLNADLSATSPMVVSHIAFNEKQVTDWMSGKFLYIGLEQRTTILPVITVVSDIKKIIIKAINNINNNYPQFAYNIVGLQNSIESLNYSEYYYNDSAIINIYHPSYRDKRAKSQVEVLQNKRQNIYSDSTLTYRREDHWRGIYAASSGIDIIQRRKDFADMKNIGNYKFTMNPMTIYNGRASYSIDFKRVDDKKGYEGTIFIDTATYAFSGFSYKLNDRWENEFERKNRFKNSFTLVNVSYKYYNNLWYLWDFSGEQYGLKDIDNSRDELKRVTIVYQTLYVDSLKAKRIPVSNRVTYNQLLIDINKHVEIFPWQKVKDILNK